MFIFITILKNWLWVYYLGNLPLQRIYIGPSIVRVTMYYYDDPEFSYPAFWRTREYEHEAEMLAIQKLLGEKRFETAVDIGGGFGRLVECLSRHARKVIVVEPSQLQRTLLASFASAAVIKEGNAVATGLPAKSCDLVVMVRVAHHLTNLQDSFEEIYKILKPGGYFIVEFANSTHFKSRLRNFVKFRSVPLEPIQVNLNEKEVTFVNHHPTTVKKMLRQEGFVIVNELSVSNFRSPVLKKLFSVEILLLWERITQKLLAHIHSGPSVFVLARRTETLKSLGLSRKNT
jgi:SAM-dependent methyltransferase